MNFFEYFPLNYLLILYFFILIPHSTCTNFHSKINTHFKFFIFQAINFKLFIIFYIRILFTFLTLYWIIAYFRLSNLSFLI